MNRSPRLSAPLVAALLLLALTHSAAATLADPLPIVAPQVVLGTAFTYQGRLTDSAGPVTAACDFLFRLYDAPGTGSPPAGGNRIGSPLLATIPVSDGLFTASLDFAAGAFDGDARWLDIQVRCPAGSGAYAGLSPRQPLTAAPYALYAPQAGFASSAPWSGLTGVPADLADGDNNTTYSNGFGLGLSGATFSVLTSTIQARVAATCAPGSSIRAIAADGAVTCQSDTTYSNGFGLSLSGSTFSVLTGTIQARVAATCAAGTSIRAIAADGAVTCEDDTSTSYTAGTGLVVSGTELSLHPAYQLPQGCSDTQVAEWNSGGWVCGTDDIGGGGGAWSLAGNSATGPGNYLGTTDNVTLTLAVSGTTAYRLVPTGSTPNLIGGADVNAVTAGAVGATIAGGGLSGYSNRVTDDYGTVGGGRANQAGNGDGNPNSARWSTVAGGAFNLAGGAFTTVGGGITNTATGTWSVVAGGLDNTASGASAAIPGGTANVAAGDYSLAAGHNAHADHMGSFVWCYSAGGLISSSGADQFVVRANGGFYFVSTTTNYSPTLQAGVFLSTTTGAHLTTGGAWTNSSDRSAKTNFQPVDAQAMLRQLASLPIQTWSYRAEDVAIRHIGPTAQDFQAAFAVGQDDTHISTVDADGVSLAAIQGLYQVVQEQEARIAGLETRLAALEQQAPPAAALPMGWLAAGALGLLTLGLLVGRRWPRQGGPL